MRWLDGITDSMDLSWENSGRQWRTRNLGMLQSMGSQRVRHNWGTEHQLRLCPFKAYVMIWLRYILKFMLLEYDGAVLSSKKDQRGHRQFNLQTLHHTRGFFSVTLPQYRYRATRTPLIQTERSDVTSLMHLEQ